MTLIEFPCVVIWNVSQWLVFASWLITWPHGDGPHAASVSILFSRCTWGEGDTQGNKKTSTTMLTSTANYSLIISTEEEEWTALLSHATLSFISQPSIIPNWPFRMSCEREQDAVWAVSMWVFLHKCSEGESELLTRSNNKTTAW